MNMQEMLAQEGMHPTGVQAVMVLTDAEVSLLVRHYETEANKWGIVPGTGEMESPAGYETAVKRLRELEELQDMLAVTRAVRTEALAEIGLNEAGRDAGSVAQA